MQHLLRGELQLLLKEVLVGRELLVRVARLLLVVAAGQVVRVEQPQAQA
jgi:hypothetical protein